MRKLLVSSQKGGVGKTTTSINLAAATALTGARALLFDADPLSSVSAALNLLEHPRRQPLRQAGIDLPGVLVCDVVPGLDVLSPYEEGGCSDEELGRLLALLGSAALEERYGALIVNTAPFMGANPGPLLATCTELLVVMRAEAMAYRTLPAFLELVQRSRGAGPGTNVRGILLTLPEGEEPGGRWERELRGRLGSRILPQAVPYDVEVEQALLSGQIVSHSNRAAPASQRYRELTEGLELAADARPSGGPADAPSALRLAAAAPARRPIELPAERPAPVAALVPAVARMVAEGPARLEKTPALPEEPRPRRRPAPDRPPARTARLSAALRVPALPPASEVPALPPGPPVPPSKAHIKPLSRAKERPEARKSQARPGDGPAPHWGLLWVGLAIVSGVALRFLRVPDWVLPLLVGVAVAAVTVVLVRQFGTTSTDRKNAPSTAPPHTGPVGDGERPSARSEPTSEASKRRPGAPQRAPASQDVGEN